MRRLLCTCFATALSMLPAVAFAQTWQEQVGYDRLISEFGVVGNGAGVLASHVEAPSSGNYMPDTAHADFAGKTFTPASGPSGISSHATGVGLNFYGNASSISGGITSITNHEANHFIESVLNWSDLTIGNGPDPVVIDNYQQNHSWIGTAPSPSNSNATNILQRIDYSVNLSRTTVVAGVNNGSATTLPQLLAHAYNVISVGRTDGNHSAGTTRFYGSGRTKPEIVAPATVTSISTPRVASAAALLHDVAGGSDATRPEVMKAILLGGATKEEFADWDRTATRPLDERYGAGELNVYNSYRILAGGEFDGSLVPPVDDAPDFGWDYGSILSPTAPVYYNIDLPGGGSDLSVLLAWNIDVTDTDGGPTFVPVTSLADMSLRLYDSTTSFLGTLVDASLSTVDNVEHIYQATLGPGRYTLEVSSSLAHTYGLAWRVTSVPVPEPSTFLLAAFASASLLALRLRATRRRRA